MEFIAYLKNNNYSKNTIKTYLSILKIYKPYLRDVRLIKKKMINFYENANTIRTHYNVLLSYMKFNNDSRIKELSKIKLPKIPMTYMTTFTKDFLYKKTENLTDRRCVWIRFLFETGMRAAEIKTIHNISKNTLLVVGKGNKVREIIHKWETTKQLTTNQFSTKTLRIWVKDILGTEFTPHSIRRSHATHMLLKGANPKTVMMQLGHSKVETTYRYLQLSKQKNINIYNKLF